MQAGVHILYLFLLYISISVRSSNSYEIIYNTENSESIQYYDCIYYTSNEIMDLEHGAESILVKQSIHNVKYCRQMMETNSLLRLSLNSKAHCFHGGLLISFSDLKRQNISTDDVVKFSSSLEQADKYSRYLSENQIDNDQDGYICNCVHPGTFGKFCEYEFHYESSSFEEAIAKQFSFVENDVGASQFHNNRPCYKTIICDYGLLCLDWRNICDGKSLLVTL